MLSVLRRNWATGFYWVGVVMTLACSAVVLAGNTDLFWRFERTGFPLSWAFAGVAILAFVAAEFGDSASSPSAAEDRSPQFSTEWEVAEPYV